MSDKEELPVLVVTDRKEEEKPRLNVKNYLNIAAYALNILVTYGVGVLGFLGLPTNEELSAKYQTIITPNGTAFTIWALIFTLQAVFAILQLFPSFGSRPVVQKGVSYWYIVVCVAQCGWTFAFAFEVIILSLIFMILIWASLMGLLISQYYVEIEPSKFSCTSGQGLLEFWLLRFPFALHGGWITAASALNVNVVAVDQQATAASQLAVGIISLAVLHAISVWHLFGYKRPNYTIPGVLIWANGFIYNELQNPDPLIVSTFDQSIISGVAYAAFSVSMVITIQVVVRVAFFVFNYIRGKSYIQEKLEEEED